MGNEWSNIAHITSSLGEIGLVQGEVATELAIAMLLKAGSKRTMHLTLKTWYPYQDQMIITLPQLTIVATFRPIQFWKYHYWAYMHNRKHHVFQSPYCTIAMRKQEMEKIS